MKRICSLLLSLCLVFGLCACGQSSPTWQEQYDLGIRYLSEGNYEEAIIAFAAAIEIDPKQAPAYSGRGQAYALSGETEENLAAALADFEAALGLDETLAEAWLGLADVYIRQGDYDKALEVLKEALAKTGDNQSIADKIAEMEGGTISDTSGKTRKSSHFENGELVAYWLYEYDERGNNIQTVRFEADGTQTDTIISEFNEANLEVRCVSQAGDGGMTVETFEYDANGRRIKEIREESHEVDPDYEGYDTYTLISYDDENHTETHDTYTDDNVLEHRFIFECDENWVWVRGVNYGVDDNGELYLDYYVEYIWNEDGSYGGYDLFQVAEREEINH